MLPMIAAHSSANRDSAFCELSKGEYIMLAITTINPGLSSADVARRHAQGQSNDYRVKAGRGYWEIVRDNVFNLFNIVLALLLVVMFLQHDFANIVLAGMAVFANMLFRLIQEINAPRALDRLDA